MKNMLHKNYPRLLGLLLLLWVPAVAQASDQVKYASLPSGVTLEYFEQGSRAAPATIFIHGYPDSWRSYQEVLAFLPDDVHAVAVSLRGFGGSSKPVGGYTLAQQAADVIALMDILEIAHASVVGHSMGSLVASVMGAAYADRVDGLVLIGTFATLVGKADIEEFWREAVSVLDDPVDPEFVRAFQESTVVRPMSSAVMDVIVSESLKAPARVWVSMMGAFIDKDFAPTLKSVKAPILFMWGSNDGLASQAEREFLVRIAAQPDVLNIAGAGHSPQWEDPAFVAAQIHAFVRAKTNG
ncbi:alpha/beta fold hydrolase [Kordiimonas aestuarii]|uniref:alpha/beta fold hydrolase n=1 Tax=Kordiimonas aestuarii TaxID=1005925 RepID=UPI0021CF9421|nr:alpha/beta hydrolase [Kordiimonas aestuarii]